MKYRTKHKVFFVAQPRRRPLATLDFNIGLDAKNKTLYSMGIVRGLHLRETVKKKPHLNDDSC